MIQDIAPHVYHCEYDPSATPDADSRILFYTPRGLYLKKGAEGDDAFLRYGELKQDNAEFRYLFAVDDIRFFMPESPLPPEALPENTAETPIFMFRSANTKWGSFVGVMGNTLYQWYNTVRYCGSCGKPMKHSETERAAVCDDCKLTVYPKISPVVIIAVTDGDKLLLTRYLNGPTNRYALVAGFVETGEMLEDAIRREVMEETGVRVKNITYYKSQPWGFSSSLLCGFFCELDGDAAVHVDGKELEEAVWLSRSEIPPREQDIALTAEMIELFRTDGWRYPER